MRRNLQVGWYYHTSLFIVINNSYSDTRLGVQAQTVAKDFRKVFEMGEKTYVGLAGLASDVISLHQLLQFRCNLYRFREHREIKPETFSALVSTLLYEKR